MAKEPDEQNIELIRGEIKKLLDDTKQIKSQAEEQLKAAEGAKKKWEDALALLAQSRDSVEEFPKFIASFKASVESDVVSIKQIKAQADEQLKAVEISRKKADDDASYANRAKISTEEHSKATAIFKGTAEADLNSIATNKKNFDELVATATLSKVAVEGDVKKIAECRKTIEESSNGIVGAATKGARHLEEISELKAKIENLLKETSVFEESASQELKQAEKARREAEKAEQDIGLLAKNTATLAETITSNHEESAQQSSEIQALLKGCQKSSADIKDVLDHLNKSDGIAIKYEKKIEDLSKKLDDLNKRAEGLLPGFTSTGLAHSFNAQKERFGVPQKRWLNTFVGCIIGLVLVAAPSFCKAIFGTPEETWGAIFRAMAMRLPIVIPLIWLAVYAGRNYMLSLRLEEDYAYKETISRAFEGYKREMKEVPVPDGAEQSPLTTLWDNVLKAIAERPGRIYEGRQKDITPLNETISAAEEFRRKQTAAS